MRTPRLGSDKSGETAARAGCGGHALEHVERADPHHRIGIRQAAPAPRSMFAGERRGASSLSALARAIAGALRSAATAASSAAASAWSAPCRMESLGVVLEALAVRSVPASRSRPPPIAPVLSRVAIVAGIGRAELDRQIGPRDAEAVIVPPVDHHVGARRHVARRAGRRGARRRHGGDASTAAYLSAAWHCRQTPSPGARSFALCGSWQSLQVTPAANILLCLNEP